MPEAAMRQQSRLPFRQDNIRLSGQILHMEAEAETGGVEHLPDRHLRLRILATIPAHFP